ncbi:hypothetical protein OG747_52805 (plasmid) [Streptomyces sp. NBC_01384]|uniref:hypothetical protein n=1 Tax=Streptomyces sp. NBC_01384 TaxID=2903847 RepID=UPI002F917905
MTTSFAPGSPRLLLIATMVLAMAGMVLLALPREPSAPLSSATPPAAAAASPTSAISPSKGPAETGGLTAATPTEPPSAPALPPHGEGVSGDRAIQRALEAAWAADLAAGDERQLLTAGRDLLRADATGIGRATWPTVFGDPDQAVAPAFASSRFRIQAAIARRDGRDDRAVVHLVWAGADRGGTYTDGRITDLHFTRTTSKKGASTWTPQPRT